MPNASKVKWQIKNTVKVTDNTMRLKAQDLLSQSTYLYTKYKRKQFKFIQIKANRILITINNKQKLKVGNINFA